MATKFSTLQRPAKSENREPIMLLEDLIELARTLPPSDQVKLVEALHPPVDETTAVHRQMIPPDYVAHSWQFSTTAEGLELMHRELEKYRENME